MITLSQAAIIGRRTVRFSIFLVIFLIIGKFVFDFGIKIYRRYYPEPPPPPTVTFGKLPKLPFPEKNKPQIEYKVETPTGSLPTFGPQAKVYFMPKSSALFFSLENSQKRAAALGFKNGSEQISPTLYKFKNSDSSASLEINSVSGIFSISRNLIGEAFLLNSRPPAPEVAASYVRAFLSQGASLPKDLDGEVIHEFLKVDAEKLTPATSLSEADLVKINLFRKKYDNLPSVTSDSKQANVWFIVSGSNDKDKKIIAGQYHYLPVSEDQSSTYPIKTVNEALKELSLGEGYIASETDSVQTNTIIRRIFFAYYDPGIPMEFYQPVFVFEGDNDFMAYVPAITKEYYSN